MNLINYKVCKCLPLIVGILFSIQYMARAQETINFSQYIENGNEAYKNQNYTDAIINYEMALLLNPSSSIGRNNLRLANDKLELFDENIESSLLIKMKGLAGFMMPKTWFILGVLFLVLSAHFLFQWWVKNNKSKRNKLFWLILLIFGFSFLLMSSLRTKFLFENPYAIVNADSQLYNGADTRSGSTASIKAGTKVHVLEKLSDFSKVRVAYTEEGWIPNEELHFIELKP
ncbi:MAG TPA: SH3 domain-containing protein [Saprospiraceae bacterium]|nr:SH3 domain-containing protein [Saprospiraceae bacterium]